MNESKAPIALAFGEDTRTVELVDEGNGPRVWFDNAIPNDFSVADLDGLIDGLTAIRRQAHQLPADHIPAPGLLLSTASDIDVNGDRLARRECAQVLTEAVFALNGVVARWMDRIDAVEP